MSKWISELVQEKQRKMEQSGRRHAHLQSFEGSKVMEGLVIGESWLEKFKRGFRGPVVKPSLHVIKRPGRE